MDYHRMFGHPSAPILIQSLQKLGLPYKHLVPYINKLECQACLMMHGHREYRTEKRTATKRALPVEVDAKDLPWGHMRVDTILPRPHSTSAEGGGTQVADDKSEGVPEPILHSVSRALVDTDIQVISFFCQRRRNQATRLTLTSSHILTPCDRSRKTLTHFKKTLETLCANLHH
jgi:hypothetical protein